MTLLPEASHWPGQIWRAMTRWTSLTDLPPTQRELFLERVRFVERALVLPVKALLLITLLWFLFFSRSFSSAPPGLAATADNLRLFFLAYSAFSLGTAIIIWGMDEVNQLTLERVIYSVSILDAVMLSAMTVLTEGFSSPLYWIFLALIFRTFATIPHAEVQTVLNLITIGCFVLGGCLALWLAPMGNDPAGNLDRPLLSSYGKDVAASRAPLVFGKPGMFEVVLIRTLLLFLTTACCHAIQVLADRKRSQEEESNQFAMKQQQLEAAGRLAGEIAHQLKNPLGIINNAAYTLAKTVKEGKTITQQISIIREEVERSDRIITELMGYARLAEGRVERVNLIEELEGAVRDVFPEGAAFNVSIRRDYGAFLPELAGQAGHFREVFANLLINAREAMDGHGEVILSARTDDQFAALISVGDNGPGIPSDKLPTIFQPYFTTKVKGTGLGLAIVKHNTELYGGSIEVESNLGIGTTFTLKFPARSLVRLRK